MLIIDFEVIHYVFGFNHEKKFRDALLIDIHNHDTSFSFQENSLFVESGYFYTDGCEISHTKESHQLGSNGKTRVSNFRDIAIFLNVFQHKYVNSLSELKNYKQFTFIDSNTSDSVASISCIIFSSIEAKAIRPEVIDIGCMGCTIKYDGNSSLFRIIYLRSAEYSAHRKLGRNYNFTVKSVLFISVKNIDFTSDVKCCIEYFIRKLLCCLN